MPADTRDEAVHAHFRAHWHTLLNATPILLFGGAVELALAHAPQVSADVVLAVRTAVLVSFAVTLAALVVLWLTTTYRLTDRALVRHSGIIRRQSLQIPLTEVVSVSVSQNLLERVLRYGDLKVETAGESTQHLTDIPRPKQFAQQLGDARDQAGASRSLRPAAAADVATELDAGAPSLAQAAARAGRVQPPVLASPADRATRKLYAWDVLARLGELVTDGVLDPADFERAVAELTDDDGAGISG